MATSTRHFDDDPLFIANLIVYLQEGHRAEGVLFDQAYISDLIAHYHELQHQDVQRVFSLHVQAGFYHRVIEQARERVKAIIAEVEAEADDPAALLREAMKLRDMATSAADKLEGLVVDG